MNLPLLSATILAPAAGALVAWRTRDAAAARRVGLVATLVTLLISAGIAVFLHRATQERLVELGPHVPFFRARWHLGVDGVSAPFLPLASAIAFLILEAAPRAALTKRAIVALLAGLAGTLGVYCSLDLLPLAVFWIATLVPGDLELRTEAADEDDRRIARTYHVFLVLGSLPMIAAAALIGWARSRAGAPWPFDLGPGTSPVPAAYQTGAFLLLALTVVVRKAVFPFHSWLPVLVEKGPPGIAALVVGTHLGAFLILRVVFPLMPDVVREDLPFLAAFALVSALYCAFVALSQRHLRRALGFVLTSQAGLVVVGLSSVRTDSLHGAMLQMLGLGLTGSGLIIVATAIQARAGTDDVAHVAGLARRFPLLAASFLLLGVASIGVPGTVQYVAEDLLLHGLLESHVILASLMLLVTVMNGINLLRLFFALFFGPTRAETPIGKGVRDLVPHESIALLTIIALLLAGGLLPQPLLDLRASAVERLVGSSAHGH